MRLAITATHGTLKAWCDEYGVSPGALNHALQGWNYPDIPPLIEWCNEKGLTLDWIFRGRTEAVAESLAARLKQPKLALPEASPEREPRVREKA